MPDRARLRLVRRLGVGFGAGVVGGWVAGLLRKPPEAPRPPHPRPETVPAAQERS